MPLTDKRKMDIVLEWAEEQTWFKKRLQAEEADRALRTARANWVTNALRDVPVKAVDAEKMKELFEQAREAIPDPKDKEG